MCVSKPYCDHKIKRETTQELLGLRFHDVYYPYLLWLTALRILKQKNHCFDGLIHKSLRSFSHHSSMQANVEIHFKVFYLSLFLNVIPVSRSLNQTVATKTTQKIFPRTVNIRSIETVRTSWIHSSLTVPTRWLPNLLLKASTDGDSTFSTHSLWVLN